MSTDPLADAVARISEMEAENDRLERENAKLRDRIAELQTLIDNELEHLAREG